MWPRFTQILNETKATVESILERRRGAEEPTQAETSADQVTKEIEVVDVATPPAQEAQGEEHEPEEADPAMSSPEYGDRGEVSADEEDMIGGWQLTRTAEMLLLQTYALHTQHP